ncbi:MAG: hypothetical protein L0323_11490 [Planctomycetes bacterium]|nr:hypothetical protein [Planctomycetota bacterium]
MNSLWLAGGLLVPTIGFVLAAHGGDEKCTGQAKAAECHGVAKGGECPADALVAKWAKVGEQMAAMSAETRETVAKARAVVSASCPVCQQGPEAWMFLARFFDSAVSLDNQFLAACGEEGKAKECEDTPKEIHQALEERIAIAAKSKDIYAAMGKVMAAGEKQECHEGETATVMVKKASKPTFAEAGKDFDSISQDAVRFTTTWAGIPAKAAALPEAKKTELLAAMDVVKKAVPACDLVKETMEFLVKGLDRQVAIDKMLCQHFEKAPKEPAAEMPAGFEDMMKAAEARASATAKVAELVRAMNKTMTPDIFQAKSAAVGAGN